MNFRKKKNMGSSSSSSVHEIKPPDNFKYFAIQMALSDRLKLVAANAEVIEKTEQVLDKYWGIEAFHEDSGYMEYQLKGSPFEPTETEDVDAKFLICTLIKQYYSIGWHVKKASDLKYHIEAGRGSDVIIFEKIKPLKTSVISISLNGTDKLRVLGPQEVWPHVDEMIQKFWPAGVEREGILNNSYEFVLRGQPFGTMQSNGVEAYYTAGLINGIFSALYHLGYIFIAAIDSGNRESDINALYFRYALDEVKEEENVNRQFFAICLNKTDRIRLVSVLPDLATSIKSIMPELWPYGVKKVKESKGSLEFTLNGNPWNSEGEESLEARELVGNLMHVLSTYNWHFYANCTLSENIDDKPTLFFRYQRTKPILTTCLCLQDTNKIRLITENKELKSIVRNAIKISWAKGIEKESIYFDSYQFQLNGEPFALDGSYSDYTCFMMLTILNALESNGLKMIASIDASGKYKINEKQASIVPVDLDTWYFSES